MVEEPFGFASKDFRIGDPVRFKPSAEVSDRMMDMPAVVLGYEMTARADRRPGREGKTVEVDHVVVEVDVNGKKIEQWVAPGDLVSVH